MLNFLRSTWNGLKRIGKALAPFRSGGGLPSGLRWVIWTALCLAVLVGLHLLNNMMRFPVKAPDWLPPAIGQFWLVILGSLVILIGVVLYWLYRLLMQGDEASVFPDIDAAWAEAMQALGRAGIHLPDVPLFFVLGRPGAGEKSLFDAAGAELVVKQTPADPHAPLHVFADRRGVFVTCRGASLLGRLAGIFALEEQSALAEEAAADLGAKTQLPGRRERKIAAMPTADSPVGIRARRRELRMPIGPNFLADVGEVRRLKARLGHLCRLIIRDRLPYCPANGILLLIPLGGTDTRVDAEQTGQACQEDLGVVRQVWKLDCPVVAVFVDLEDLPGFSEFARRNSGEVKGRIGQRFPMATRLSKAQVADEIKSSLMYVCNSYLQGVAYPHFQAEKQANLELGPIFAANAELFLFLEALQNRSDALAAIVKQSVAPEKDTLLRYAGCYLAGTGQNAAGQGFVAGVLQRLVDEQSSVSWTDSAFAEDASGHRWANTYFMVAAILSLAWVVLLAYLLWGIFQGR